MDDKARRVSLRDVALLVRQRRHKEQAAMAEAQAQVRRRDEAQHYVRTVEDAVQQADEARRTGESALYGGMVGQPLTIEALGRERGRIERLGSRVAAEEERLQHARTMAEEAAAKADEARRVFLERMRETRKVNLMREKVEAAHERYAELMADLETSDELLDRLTAGRAGRHR